MACACAWLTGPPSSRPAANACIELANAFATIDARPTGQVDILTEKKHPGIIGLVGAHLWKKQLWVLLELCEGGALDDILLGTRIPVLPGQQRCNLAAGQLSRFARSLRHR